MMFWLAAVVLTFATSLAVLLPLTRKPQVEAADSAYDLSVYRDQLSEVDRDRERGAIAPEEAEQARAEIARRILKLDALNVKAGSGQAKPSRIIASAAVLSIPLVSWGFYALVGSPDLPSQPLAARLDKSPADATPEELVARAEQALAQNPSDARGWTVLAPIYVRMERFAEAVVAYRNAIRLSGEDADKLAGLGEALVMQAGGVVTRDSENAFNKALELEAGYPKARFFLAMGMAQEGRPTDAAALWRDLAETAPADSRWKNAAEAALARMSEQNASEQSAADQNRMIEQMVAGLDQKLRTSPQDPEGWMQLMRSYRVLGKDEAARDAFRRALDALGADSEAGRNVAAFAAEQGVELTP